MKSFSLFATVLLLGVTLGAGDAEAKRLGSGKSIGMQRQATTPDKAPTPAAAPSATPATAAAAAPAGGAAAAAAKPRSSWMGPVAGLAAGLGIAALASHLGFGEELASMLLIGLLVVAALAVVGFVMRRRAAAQSGSGFDRMQYAAAGGDAGQARSGGNAFERAMPLSASGAGPAAGGAISGTTISAAKMPADFDAAGFARNAKVNYIRLQAAYDAANLDDIRAFTTPEVFAEIRMDLSERAGAVQETDVVRIDAEVLEVAEEDQRYVVSVRFQGLVRESGDASPQPVDEVWHMTKPRDGSSGWVIAGIQQMQ